MCGTVRSLREDEHVNCNSNYNRSDRRNYRGRQCSDRADVRQDDEVEKMRKVTYVCDLCGDEYKERLFWTLEYPSVDHADNRKEVMHICGTCAKWIMKQRGKGGEKNE